MENRSEREIVILLHDIGHAFLNMLFLEHSFRKNSYKTYSVTYPSIKYDIEDNAAWLNKRLEERKIWADFDRVHFVTHSMGGLVTGFYLQDFKGQIPAKKLGHVVMLGIPHGGSEVADKLHKLWLFKKVFGPAGQQLTTLARGKEKIAPYYRLGIIAGSWGKFHPLGPFMKSEHDGCVSIDSTQVEGMSDHIVMPVSHSFMAWSFKVKDQVQYFLKHGEFQHAA